MKTALGTHNSHTAITESCVMNQEVTVV